MFKGHQFVKLLNDTWVFDLTEYVGYKVKVNDNGEVLNYKEAFEAKVVGDEIILNKFMRVPMKVLKEASNQIKIYEKIYGDLEDDN